MESKVSFLKNRLAEIEEMLNNRKPWQDKEELQYRLTSIKSAIDELSQ